MQNYGEPQLRVEESTATITFDRPQLANRLSPRDLQVVREHINSVNAMESVLVLRFTGAGKYFCSGYDIGALASPDTAESAGAPAFGDLIDLIEAARPVTIAAVNGGVYGGATDLCLACDFRVGVPHCEMFMPAARLGLHFYRGGLERYVSRLGVDTAKRLFLAADRLDAAEMLRTGFLTEIVAADALAQRVDQLSATLCGMAPLALLGMKQALNQIARGALDAAALERAIAQAGASADLREGAAAWREKRPPVFTGR
ncbi:enoyl-CoA hydratase/isomerase family protein [Cupriavidus sp. 30B13]|uniref:enoyl-CoA hydratase/isomerase family protein n=1 Tax=Cupriavidus sp. 30B13 TaxID=3384241 RepID=UPI003B9007D7